MSESTHDHKRHMSTQALRQDECKSDTGIPVSELLQALKATKLEREGTNTDFNATQNSAHTNPSNDVTVVPSFIGESSYIKEMFRYYMQSLSVSESANVGESQRPSSFVTWNSGAHKCHSR